MSSSKVHMIVDELDLHEYKNNIKHSINQRSGWI